MLRATPTVLPVPVQSELDPDDARQRRSVSKSHSRVGPFLKKKNCWCSLVHSHRGALNRLTHGVERGGCHRVRDTADRCGGQKAVRHWTCSGWGSWRTRSSRPRWRCDLLLHLSQGRAAAQRAERCRRLQKHQSRRTSYLRSGNVQRGASGSLRPTTDTTSIRPGVRRRPTYVFADLPPLPGPSLRLPYSAVRVILELSIDSRASAESSSPEPWLRRRADGARRSAVASAAQRAQLPGCTPASSIANSALPFLPYTVGCISVTTRKPPFVGPPRAQQPDVAVGAATPARARQCHTRRYSTARIWSFCGIGGSGLDAGCAVSVEGGLLE